MTIIAPIPIREKRKINYKGIDMQLHVYSFFVSRKLDPHKPVICEICMRKIATDIMHIEGRIEEKYDDPNLLIAGCRSCHKDYDLGHKRTAEQLKKRVQHILSFINRSKRKNINNDTI